MHAAFKLFDWCRLTVAKRKIPAAKVYVLHSFEYYRAIRSFAKTSGAIILYDAHDFYRGIAPQGTATSYERNFLNPLLCALEDQILAEADATTTVSEGVARLLNRFSPKAVHVIRNVHDGRKDDPSAVSIKDRLKLASTDELMVVVGNYKPGMAAEAAIESLRHLPTNFHLAFIGRGYEICDTSKFADVSSRLHFGIALAPTEIVPSIRSASVGLVLYRPCSENYMNALPNGFFQLVAAGLPIVRGRLSQIEGAISTLDIGKCLCDLHPLALAEAVLCTLRRQRLGLLNDNIAALSERLNWERERTKLADLLDQAEFTKSSPIGNHVRRATRSGIDQKGNK
ncbi:MAG: hypothetical protein KIT48_08915 [Pseudolabrys sp.]|nr:hypothetical protein [Pseudolabrys sp.]